MGLAVTKGEQGYDAERRVCLARQGVSFLLNFLILCRFLDGRRNFTTSLQLLKGVLVWY